LAKSVALDFSSLPLKVGMFCEADMMAADAAVNMLLIFGVFVFLLDFLFGGVAVSAVK
jgi:hypothetical protein